MADRLSRREVDPHLRLVLNRRVGDETELVPFAHLVDVAIAPGEHGSVDGGPEPWRLAYRKGRRRS